MRCSDIHDHLKSRGTWVNWDRPTDSFKFGDPDTPLDTLATMWKADWASLRAAHERGAQLVISHESIFVRGGHGPEEEVALPTEADKLQWLKDTGLVVYRCHDVWDNFPEIGIRDSWQRNLQLNGRIVTDRFPVLVTEIEPIPFRELALHVVSIIRPLGQQHIQIAGNPDKIVNRVATGTGVTPDPMLLYGLDADCGVMTDDYFLFVREGAHGIELDFPMMFVNHGVAEEWGVANIGPYLQQQFPDLNIFHVPQQCPWQVVS